jgi:DNA-binding PadR family transcriptional regulator
MEPKEIYRSLIRLHILIEASKRPVNSGGVTGKLHDRGFTLSLARVRDILRDFEGKGYLVSTGVRDGRVRRMYTITQTGRIRMQDANKKVGELIEILGSAGLTK